MTRKEALKDVEVLEKRIVTTRVVNPDYFNCEKSVVIWAVDKIYIYRGVRFSCLKSDSYVPMEYATTFQLVSPQKRSLNSALIDAKDAIDRNFDKVDEAIAKAKHKAPVFSIQSLINYGLL